MVDIGKLPAEVRADVDRIRELVDRCVDVLEMSDAIRAQRWQEFLAFLAPIVCAAHADLFPEALEAVGVEQAAQRNYGGEDEDDEVAREHRAYITAALAAARRAATTTEVGNG